ncbi:MAG: cytochrome c, partial [Magnetospirillum sp.]|nr:cytochrome c [Magnetospirillum sp.]
MRAWVLAGLGMVIGAAGLLAWPKARPIDPTNARQVEQGRLLYAQHCASCHGTDLAGEADWQTRKPSG